jgi:hypothetical protein
MKEEGLVSIFCLFATGFIIVAAMSYHEGRLDGIEMMKKHQRMVEYCASPMHSENLCNVKDGDENANQPH